MIYTHHSPYLPEHNVVLSTKTRSKPCADFRLLSKTEIERNIQLKQKEIMQIRFKQATRQEYKSSEITNKKREIAQLFTIHREKQIAEGVSHAAYKKMKNISMMTKFSSAQ